jgi:SAM-dependent methyltransferase
MLNDLRFYGPSPPAQVETILTSCLDADFPAESFDTVCAIFVLHHLAQESTRVSRDRVCAMMQKAFRFLRPGGHLLIAENSAKALEWPYHVAYRPLYSIFRQSKSIELPHFWSTRQLLAMLGGAGFDDVVFVHLPVRERIANPMSGLALSPFLINLMQQMTLFVATKPGSSERHLARPAS